MSFNLTKFDGILMNILMKTFFLNRWTFVLLAIILVAPFCAQAQRNEFYQLKTYTCETDQQVAAVDNYLEKAYLPALKRLGINQVGVFKYKQVDSVAPPKKIIVLIPSPSIEVFDVLERELARDKVYLTDGADYLKATYDNPPYQRISSIFLKAFDDMPKMKPSIWLNDREERVYELRSYESPTEALFERKVEMFNEGGEIRLFDTLEFNAIFYASVIAGPNMPNLMYMTSFKNMQSRDEHWKSFDNAPAWKELSAKEKYQHTVSHADIMLLYPTAYSDY